MTSRFGVTLVLIGLGAHLLLHAQGRGGGGFPGGGFGRGGVPPDAPRGRDPQEPDQTPTFRSGVTLVQIDAFVTDAEGRPITDLTADDFEVWERDQLQPITSFASVNIPIGRPVARSGDRAAEPDVLSNMKPQGRTYLIALDEVSPDRVLKTRNIVRRFIDEHLGPNDVASIALTGRGLADSGQDFTGNRRLLLAALDKFTGGFEASTPNAQEANGGVQGPGVDRAFSSDPRQLMSSLRRLTEFLATLPGRKTLLYVGEGLGGVNLFTALDYRGGALTPTEIDAHAAVAAATRGNVAIYPIDPRGLTTDLSTSESFASPTLENRADMAALADITGGFLVTSSNSFGTAFDRLVRDNSAYYTIGFGSTYERRDGRFVGVKVRVKRTGLVVRSRDGYVAPLGRERAQPALATDARMPAVANAMANPVAIADVGMRVFASPFRAGRHASVALAIEIDVSKLDLVNKAGSLTGDLEVSYLATDARGKVRPGRRHTATLTLKPEAVERVFATGVRFVSEFDLPHGRYQLRVAAGGAVRAGSIVYDLEVPDFGDGPLTMSGIALTSSLASRVMTLPARNPLADVLPGPPTTARDFTRDDTITFFAEIYDNAARGTGAIAIAAELRSEYGHVVPIADERRSSASPRRGSGGHGFTARLPLKDVPPGAYTLHVEARSDASAGRAVSRDVPLRVR